MSVTQLIEAAREAAGLARSATGADLDSAILLEGKAEELGTPCLYSLLFTFSGMFLERIEGRIARTTGFDGATLWAADDSGIARRLVFEERDLAFLPVALLTHSWLREGSPIAIAASGVEGTREGAALGLGIAGSDTIARLVLDERTHLPRTLIVPEIHSGEQRWEFGDYRQVGGLTLAHSLVHAPLPGVTNVYTARSAREIAAPGAEAFRPGPSRPTPVRFAGAPGPVPIERAWTGHLLVRVQINGRDPGPFILDTGAAVSLITRQAAEAAGMDGFGRSYIAGAGDSSTTTILRGGGKLEIGGVTIPDLVFVEADLAPLGSALRTEVAGVIGYDLFARCIAEIDLGGDSMTLHDPSRHRLEGGEWENLILHRKHPLVRCRFEGEREGLFLWDTGAGNNPVVFTAPAVEAFGLLDGRETREAQTMGAGGMGAARIGRIGYMELAGARLDDQVAVFAAARKGALADPCIDGIIGNALVSPFKVVLNYPLGKISFVRRDRGPEDATERVSAARKSKAG